VKPFCLSSETVLPIKLFYLSNSTCTTTKGQLLNYGARGMAQDHRAAYRYFTQAAAAGDADAMSHLGHMHANGLGVKVRRCVSRAPPRPPKVQSVYSIVPPFCVLFSILNSQI
jgi:hypothetical protein